jgi:ADP-ribose pyrophosphatase
LHWEKHPDDLLHVLAELRDQYPSASLILVGDGEMKSELQTLAASLGVLENVMFVGAVNQGVGLAIVQQCDIYVAPMQGNAMVEAMVADLPIVAYEHSWHANLIKNEETALLTPYRDTHAMTQAVCRLISDNALGPRLSAAAKATAMKEHSPDIVAARLYDVFDLAIRLNHRSARPAATPAFMSDEFPMVLSTKRTLISRWLDAIKREVQFQSDAAAETYYATAEPAYVAAIAMSPERRILLVKQYRPAIRRFSLELPAGTVEANEAPADTMVRELLEETGYRTKSIVEIGRAATSAGRIDNLTHSFFIETGERLADFTEEPGVAVSSASGSELRELIESGEFAEQTHLGAIALAACRRLVEL